MRSVRINWEGIRRFLGFSGTVDEMRQLELPRSCADWRYPYVRNDDHHVDDGCGPDGCPPCACDECRPVLPVARIVPRQVPPRSWWRAAFYPWSYPDGPPDGRPDSPLCHLCGLEFRWKWEPGLAVCVYSSDDVEPGETCFRCGKVKR